MREISAKNRDRPACSESWTSSVAPTASGVIVSAAARTGAPAIASTTLTAHRAQQRALARHVRAAHDQQPCLRRQEDVVAHHARRRHERMSEARPFEPRRSSILDEGRKWIVGMFVCVGGKRAERLVLGHRGQPRDDLRAEFAAPDLDRRCDVQRP